MTYRYIYKITCTAGDMKGHFYYGQHTTTNINDKYKGTGKLILEYYKKYPYDYIKEIIAYYNTEEELNNAEYDIIKENINDPLCMNMKIQSKVYNQKDFNKAKEHIHIKHTNEEKQKNSEMSSNRIWLNNGVDHKFVKKEYVNKFLALGYKFGRISWKK